MNSNSVDLLKFRHGVPGEIDALLREARDCGVELKVSAGKLRFDAPAGAMSDRLRAALGQYREAIVAALRGPAFRARGPVETAPLVYHYRDLFKKLRTGELGVEYANSTHSVFRFTGHLNTKGLIAGIRAVLDRHPILGARAQIRGGVPVFVYSRDVNVYFSDESHGTDAERTPRVQALIDDLVWRPFDLERETLFRPFVVKVAPLTHVMGFVIHHLIGDLISIALATQDIFRGYAGLRTGSAESPALQYSDYLLEMEEWLLSVALRYRLDYWMRRLLGVRDSCLEPDFTVSPDEGGTLRSEMLDLPGSRPDDLRELASRLGVTLFTLLLAIYYCTLRRQLDRSDLVILMMHHGRDHPGLAKMVGSFQNQIPVRIAAAAETGFSGLAQSIQEYCSSSSEQYVPYGNIRHEFFRTQTSHVFPELNFVPLAAGATRGGEHDALKAEPTRQPPTRRTAGEHPYHVMDIAMLDSRVKLKCTYLDILFRRDTIARHLQVFAEIALQVISHPYSTVGTICKPSLCSAVAGQGA